MTACRRRGAAALLGVAVLLTGTGCLEPSARGVAIWVADGDEDILADTPPSSENDVFSAARGQVRLRAALNETVALQVALRSSALPAGPFDVRVSDLAGPGERLTADVLIRRYRVQYTKVTRFRSWYPAHTGRPAMPGLFPDVLVPWDAPRGGGPVQLTEARNELVWIDFAVPPTARPGVYRGRLEVRHVAERQPRFACDLVLEVLPVALPGRHGLPVLCRVDPGDLLAMHLRWPRTPAEQLALLPDAPSHLAAVGLVRETLELLHAHRMDPLLWAAFPKFQATDDRRVAVDWAAYDALVAGWLDGSAFPDRAPVEYWPIPASLDYPDAARNGGLGSPRYARLLAAYLAECRRHFAERGWLDRAVLRVCPPAPLDAGVVDRVRTLTEIVRRSEAPLAVVAHLPARSLAGLGWAGAPAVELPDVTVWAPPAMWFEPAAVASARQLGRAAWLMPDRPPYSGALTIEAPATDARVLAWQAYRLGASALWIEDAARAHDPDDPGDLSRPAAMDGLVQPAADYGIRERPLATLRLKRLRRGVQDYELLRLLEENGRRLLAESLVQQVVRWAGTDACRDNLLSGRESGWSTDPAVLRTARELMLAELAAAPGEPRAGPLAAHTRWALLMNQAERVAVRVEGVRLTRTPDGLRANIRTSVTNTANRSLAGRWRLPAPPPGWRPPAEVPVTAEPGQRQVGRMLVDVSGLSYNTDGVYPFDLALDTAAVGAFPVAGRLAVAACPVLPRPPRIDGRLDDWPLASSNALGDFRLAYSPGEPTGLPPPATLPTQAFVGMDATTLYVGVRCGLRAGEPPIWRPDNEIPVDGATPWGQDVIEILIDPRDVPEGTSADVYCVQIKPSGLTLARRGCYTDPPMGRSEPWVCRPRVAVQVTPEAWTVELALPLAALGPEARRQPVWGFNVTRLDARRGEYASWSGARGFLYAPQALGNLLLLWP